MFNGGEKGSEADERWVGRAGIYFSAPVGKEPHPTSPLIRLGGSD